MFEKRKYLKEIKKCRATIQEIERKRSRSQSALVQAILLQEEPKEADVEWFNKYTGEISAVRKPYDRNAEKARRIYGYKAGKEKEESTVMSLRERGVGCG